MDASRPQRPVRNSQLWLCFYLLSLDYPVSALEGKQRASSPPTARQWLLKSARLEALHVAEKLPDIFKSNMLALRCMYYLPSKRKITEDSELREGREREGESKEESGSQGR